MLKTAYVPGAVFDDVREFIEACREVDEVQDIHGADWDLEVGALTEATAEYIKEPPLLLFDHIKDYPAGYRIMSLPRAAYRRAAIALGLPPDKTKLELARMAARKIAEAPSIPPVEVSTGPIMENVLTGDAVDLWRFPVPRYHPSDGGRYIGTGDNVINRDPESGYVNMGTYRIQVHDRALLGIWMSPGQQGRQICQRYWDRGESCPIVAIFGEEPLQFMISHSKFPWGRSELDILGGIRGRPLEVIKGPITGLPIPAHAEIAIEGEVPPPSVEAREEGPFGEWPGYYSGGTLGTGDPQPVIRVKAIYHRNDPILFNEAPLWPGAPKDGIPIPPGVLWGQLEAAGIQDIVGVWEHSHYLVVVSIRQRYPGHAKQTGMAALSCAANARNGRYYVVVDEDIDPTNIDEVLWAMESRSDPYRDIDLIDKCWSTALDPRVPPEKRATGDYTNSRAVIMAVRPFEWRDKFAKVSRTPVELKRQMVEKYRSILPFPRGL